MSDTLNIKQRSLFTEILTLIKYRLSLSVVFSSVASYLIAFEVFSLLTFTLLILGGFDHRNYSREETIRRNMVFLINKIYEVLNPFF